MRQYQFLKMEYTISEVHIKQEEPDADTSSSTVLATKIYSIGEQADQKYVMGPRIPQLCEPKEEVLSENDMDINETQYGEQEGDIYEDFFVVKEELEEPSSSDSEFIDGKYEDEIYEDGTYEEDTAKDNFGSDSKNIAGIVEGIQKDDPRSNQIMLCPFCGIEFENCSDWRQHLNDIHEFNKFESLNVELIGDIKAQCNQCQMEMSSRLQNLQNHKITHLPFKQYIKCKLCEKLFTRGGNHILHFDQMHNTVNPKKGKTYSNDLSCQTNIIDICPYCGIEFQNYYKWRQHLYDIHGFNKFESLNVEFIGGRKAKCKECNVEMGTKMQSLQYHKITHLPFKQFIKCKLCDKLFTRRTTHMWHYNHVHNVVGSGESKVSSNDIIFQTNAILICPYCGTEYQNYSKWRRHLIEIHDFYKFESLNMEAISESKAKCKQCQIEMSSRLQNLQKHKITHLPFKQYIKCKLCEKLFTRGENHMLHFEQMHTIVRSEEEGMDCSIATTDKNNVILICPYCGVEYQTYSKWRRHLNDIHYFNKLESLNVEAIGESKAKCKECKKVIKSQLLILQCHRITHLPYKRYVKCTLCEKMFISGRAQRRHFDLSHNEMVKDGPNGGKQCQTNADLLCPFCGIVFSNFFEWRQHLNDLHEFNNRDTLNMEFVGDNKAQCKQCNLKIITKLHSLQNHKITHLPYKRYFKCKLCGQLFGTGNLHKQHMESSHSS